MAATDPYKPERAVITGIVRETDDTLTYRMRFDDPRSERAYSFTPGQFNMVSVLGVGEAPISISSGVSEDGFSHTIRQVGRVTGVLAGRNAGDTVWVRGPYGRGWPMDRLRGRNVLIVAGGIGLAPLRPVITGVIDRRGDYGCVELLYGARTPDDMLYRGEWERWRQRIDVRLTVDRAPDGWEHATGVVTGLFDDMTSRPGPTEVLTCGPEIMMRFVVRDLIARGFPDRDIYVSLERRMSCGVGKCGNCQIGPYFSCADGPVFNLSELEARAGNVLGR